MPSGNYGVILIKPQIFIEQQGSFHTGIKIPSNVHFNGTQILC